MRYITPRTKLNAFRSPGIAVAIIVVSTCLGWAAAKCPASEPSDVFVDGSDLVGEPESPYFAEALTVEPASLTLPENIEESGANVVSNLPADDVAESAMKALDNCNEGYAKMYREFYHPMNSLTASTKTPALGDSSKQDSAELTPPEDCAQKYFATFGSFDGSQREWADLTPLGMPFVFCHRPLYFEDANLERCGYGCRCCCQPLISGAHFFGTIPLLPYKMAYQCPCECVRSLGRCPEGCRWSCCENYLPPFDLCAATVEAAAITGLIFIIP